MNRNRLLLLVLPLVLGACQSHRNTAERGWVSLFNGRDLTGWLVKINGYPLGENHGNTFRVEDGLLQVRYDQYAGFDNKFGSLYYDREFTNYRLRLEYRFVGETAPGGPSWGYKDSGVQYHCQAPSTVGLNQPFPVCLEYNLHGGNGTEGRPTGQLCTPGTYVQITGQRNAAFCTPPTVQRTFHGEEWVTLEIDVRDGQIKHFVNGEEILRFEDPRYDAAHELGKTMIEGGEDRVRSGFISLQSNSHPVDFRRIEIKEY